MVLNDQDILDHLKERLFEIYRGVPIYKVSYANKNRDKFCVDLILTKRTGKVLSKPFKTVTQAKAYINDYIDNRL